MLCETVRKGQGCPFMKASGCSYNGGICHEIVEQCNGCKRTVEYASGVYCASYPDPAVKWKNGGCNLASHVQAAVKKAAKINPLKASKRARK